jgi:hypothetical protein
MRRGRFILGAGQHSKRGKTFRYLVETVNELHAEDEDEVREYQGKGNISIPKRRLCDGIHRLSGETVRYIPSVAWAKEYVQLIARESW